MATLNLVQTFNNIKDKFNEIKTTEHFVMDPLYDYHPRDLTSYDERRSEYNAMYPDKKEKRNRFFDHIDDKKNDNDKCKTASMLDVNCYGNLKGVIWVLIIVAIFLTLIFIIFVISKLFSGSGSVQNPASQGPPTLQKSVQPPVQTVQTVQPPVQQSQPVPEQKRNFFDRLLGNKAESAPEQAQPPKTDFMSRLLGSKPVPKSA
jgi:hypothetical protein